MEKVEEVGYNVERHVQHPREKEFHNCFKESFSGEEMDLLVFGHTETLIKEVEPNDYLSSRERKIMLSTIQWLGSSQGKAFLQSCGYDIVKHYKKREKLTSKRLACLEKQLDKIPTWIKSIFK